MSDDSLPAPMRYLGGKSAQWSEIKKNIPPHDTYVEPFAGMGTVFYRKPKSKRSVLADRDCPIVNFHKTIQKNKNPVKCGSGRGRKFITKRAKRRDYCGTFLNLRCQMGGTGGFDRDACIRRNPYDHRMYRKWDGYHDKLKGVRLKCVDWKSVAKQHDKPNTFIYLDPPYDNTRHQSNWGEKGNIGEVCKFAKSAKAKVMVSHYDTPETRKSCKGLKIRSYSAPRRISNLAGRGYTAKREVLMTNY